MRIDFHDLYDGQFEDLISAICAFLLGPAVQKFSSGPDGGRDARFAGTANQFPSARAPHSGKFVIQAKHSESPIAKLSDPDFVGDQDSSVISKEVPRIKALVAAGEPQLGGGGRGG